MRVPLYRGISDEILALINSGELRCGERIYSSREIVEKYGVSQITALRVFKELVASGLVVRRNGLGYFVRGVEEKGRGEYVFCAFRPPRQINFTDNYGTRIFFGIVSGCALSGQSLMLSRHTQAIRFQNLLQTTEETARAVAAEIDSNIESLGGILLDMRFSDEHIAKHILPVAGNCPVVVIGRDSDLPLFTCSRPLKSCASEVANLAVNSSAEHFFLFPLTGVYDSQFFCSCVEKELLRLGVAANHIQVVEDGLQNQNRDLEIYDEIVQFVQSHPKKLMLISSGDHWSLALLKSLRAKGVELGRDVTLISLDGLEGISAFAPRITSINFFPERMGELAVEIVLSGNHTVKRSYFTDYKVELNETCFFRD
jgi:DNA-binding LacI/PurR family transcriptional regulator